MGVDIIIRVEKKINNKWVKQNDAIYPIYDELTDAPFSYRNYTVFGFLAGIRNNNKQVFGANKGIPKDMDGYEEYTHQYTDGFFAHSWILLKDLINFNYNSKNQFNEKYKDRLGDLYFEHLKILKTVGLPEQVRIVFCFDH